MKTKTPAAPVERKPYVAKVEFWRFGLPVAAGTPIQLSTLEVKYLGHVVEPAKVVAVAEPAPEVVEVAVDPVEDKVADEHPRRKK
jgi:hypothetical protein